MRLSSLDADAPIVEWDGKELNLCDGSHSEERQCDV